jgi:arsenite methyltransferase
MSVEGRKSETPDYGLDAPGTVRNLLLAGGLGILTWATAAVGLWPGVAGGVALANIGAATGTSFTLTGLYMIYASKVGKIRSRDRLLDLLPWRGDELALDVGCGRGLMLIGVAKRLTGGKATGIDIWQTEDQSGNRPEATLENARREGVAGRVEIKTADMRQIPFPDGTFDVVVSSWAIHNLYKPEEREQAIREIARVLRPGGVALIKDIRHVGQYQRAFEAHGCPGVRRLDWRVLGWAAALFTFGSLLPGALIAKKAGGPGETAF